MMPARATMNGLVFSACRCCGNAGIGVWIFGDLSKPDTWRCDRHQTRNPCAVEGCKRTTSTSGYLGCDVYLCGEHFRQACPPGSAERRVYRRFFRMAKKRATPDNPGGWSPDLERRYWRVWARIVAIARAQAAGDIDMDEINKLFGWA